MRHVAKFMDAVISVALADPPKRFSGLRLRWAFFRMIFGVVTDRSEGMDQKMAVLKYATGRIVELNAAIDRELGE